MANIHKFILSIFRKSIKLDNEDHLMKEIRFQGRGGQGVVLTARMVAIACAREGKCVASFPMYGFERRGAPVVAYVSQKRKDR
jgi:Pyruvate/2-oxoacid:ferredoxin oxidoreductase gamma subunit